MVLGGLIRGWSCVYLARPPSITDTAEPKGSHRFLFCKCDWGVDIPVLTVFILRELPSVCVCMRERHPSRRSVLPMHSQTDPKRLSQKWFNCRVLIVVPFCTKDWVLCTLDPIYQACDTWLPTQFIPFLRLIAKETLNLQFAPWLLLPAFARNRSENSFNLKVNCRDALWEFTSGQFSFNQLLPQLHLSTCSLRNEKETKVKNVPSIFRAKPSSSFYLLPFPQWEKVCYFLNEDTAFAEVQQTADICTSSKSYIYKIVSSDL